MKLLEYAIAVKAHLVGQGELKELNKEDVEFMKFCQSSDEEITAEICADGIINYRSTERWEAHEKEVALEVEAIEKKWNAKKDNDIEIFDQSGLYP